MEVAAGGAHWLASDSGLPELFGDEVDDALLGLEDSGDALSVSKDHPERITCKALFVSPHCPVSEVRRISRPVMDLWVKPVILNPSTVTLSAAKSLRTSSVKDLRRPDILRRSLP
jgi:hypothetical protein